MGLESPPLAVIRKSQNVETLGGIVGLETPPLAVIRKSRNVGPIGGSVGLETMNENIKIQRKKTSK